MDMTRTGTPYLVGKDDIRGSLKPLKRMPLDRTGSEITEKWLQELIDEAPNVLPVSQVYARVAGDLHSMGREIATAGGGSIDNLLISGSGHLIVVETKLWRNHQARREVVAQIIEYAQDVRDWDYEKVEKLWCDRHGQGQTLHAAIAADVDEAEWVDRVNNQVAAGEIILLIVGDGIDSRAENLAETVGGRPDMMFRLALVELRVYSADGRKYLIIPSTMARTAEIQRATVRVIFDSNHRPDVRVEAPRPDAEGRAASGNRVSLDATQFLSQLEEHKNGGIDSVRVVEELLRLLDRQEVLIVEWQTAGFSIRFLDPISSSRILPLVVVSAKGRIYAHLPNVGNPIRKRWDNPTLAPRLESELAGLFEEWGENQVRITRKDKEIELPLAVLTGKERRVIGSLCDFVTRLQKQAPPLDE
ncbi:hypothetical protein [Candidatus Rariloculus sp.]|uniref:hypothetical protein n=1 Tax=Candidatus Rariloculus sp. TaxID=3101265 RepID=UPI003D112C7F